MIGQVKLINKLKSYSISTLPSSILFVGDKGCGKHTLVKELSNYFNLDIVDMSKNISFDYIQEIYTKALPAFYLIDMNIVNEKQQNMILKFIEEPVKSSFIILISDSKANLLNTIVNRCILFEFEPYTKQDLATFLKSNDNVDDVLNLCNTPGQILSMNSKSLNDLYELCDKIINKMKIANYPNTLSIANKINFKDEYDKYDINVFFNALLVTILNEYLNSNNNFLIDLYKLVLNEKKKLKDTRLNKEMFMEYFLTLMWEESRK